jgi:hypothetical protein
MRVAVSGVDRGARFADVGRTLDMPWTKRERLPTAAVEHNCVLAEARHVDPCDRPRVCPRPGFDDMAGRKRFGEGAFEQNLREHRLGVNPKTLADQNKA